MTDAMGDEAAKRVGYLWPAFQTWTEYSEGVENLVHLTHEGLDRVRATPELFRILEKSPESIERAEWKAKMASAEIDAGYPTLHAHGLLGLWGALECLIEDLFLAVIAAKPELLRGELFSKVKLPVAVMYGGDEADRLRAILTETSRATNADVGVGASRFERLLEQVGFGGPIPKQVKDALFTAQQIRNVWAHRAGVADQRFVERCPQLRFGLGDRVNMDPDMFMGLMHGVHMYGIVIVNRYADHVGNERVTNECQGYEGCLAELPPRS